MDLKWRKAKGRRVEEPGLYLISDASGQDVEAQHMRVGESFGVRDDDYFAGPVKVAPYGPALELPEFWAIVADDMVTLLGGSFCGHFIEVESSHDGCSMHVTDVSRAICVRRINAALKALEEK